MENLTRIELQIEGKDVWNLREDYKASMRGGGEDEQDEAYDVWSAAADHFWRDIQRAAGSSSAIELWMSLGPHARDALSPVAI